VETANPTVQTEARDIHSRKAAAQDRDLAQRLREGNHAAHGELCDRFGAVLHGFAAHRLGGDQESAEDVMVQTLVEVTQNIERFDPSRGGLAAWVYGIARRKIQDARRRARRKKSVPASARTSLDHAANIASSEDLASDVAAQLDAQRQVALIAAALSEMEMEVLLLHSVDGFSVGDIGRIVGRSAKAVDSLLHRARGKAREALVKIND
jgi:RNA polymerase sigma-70 factor (ECF subfamily)